MNYKFTVAVPLAALALFLQIFIGDTSGTWINFALATLIASAFFVDLVELFVLIFLSVFALNWQPSFSLELLSFAAIPLAVFFLRGRIPFSPRLANILAISAGIGVLYLGFGTTFFIDYPAIFLQDASLSVATGIVVFQVLHISLSKRS